MPNWDGRQGAYGTVWKGTDRKTGNVVAIKQMSKAPGREPGGYSMIFRETTVMSGSLHYGDVGFGDRIAPNSVTYRYCVHSSSSHLFDGFDGHVEVYNTLRQIQASFVSWRTSTFEFSLARLVSGFQEG